MEPAEIASIYETLAPMATDYANANLERAGQAQASIGPLAEAVMGENRTAGIGNYTYNRLVRPAVDTMRDQLVVEGLSAALNKQLSDSLNQAKQNYSRASRRSSGGGSTGDSDEKKGWSGEIERETVDSKNVSKKKNTDNFDIIWSVSPNGIRTQWKVIKDENGNVIGYDNFIQSYESGSGKAALQGLTGKGHKITDASGKDITVRYK